MEKKIRLHIFDDGVAAADLLKNKNKEQKNQKRVRPGFEPRLLVLKAKY